MTERLDEAAVALALEELPEWRSLEHRPAIARDFVFRDFNAAFGFMCRAALHAEKLNHHPEWSNVYNRVAVVLTTHSAKGVTELDLQMARLMNSIAT